MKPLRHIAAAIAVPVLVVLAIATSKGTDEPDSGDASSAPPDPVNKYGARCGVSIGEDAFHEVAVGADGRPWVLADSDSLYALEVGVEPEVEGGCELISTVGHPGVVDFDLDLAGDVFVLEADRLERRSAAWELFAVCDDVTGDFVVVAPDGSQAWVGSYGSTTFQVFGFEESTCTPHDAWESPIAFTEDVVTDGIHIIGEVEASDPPHLAAVELDSSAVVTPFGIDLFYSIDAMGLSGGRLEIADGSYAVITSFDVPSFAVTEGPNFLAWSSLPAPSVEGFGNSTITGLGVRDGVARYATFDPHEAGTPLVYRIDALD